MCSAMRRRIGVCGTRVLAIVLDSNGVSEPPERVNASPAICGELPFAVGGE